MAAMDDAFGELSIDEEEALLAGDTYDDPNAVDLELDFELDFETSVAPENHPPPTQTSSLAPTFQDEVNEAAVQEHQHPRITVSSVEPEARGAVVVSSERPLRAPKAEVAQRFNLGRLHNAMHAVVEDRMLERRGRAMLADNVAAMDREELRLNHLKNSARPVVEVAPIESDGRSHGSGVINHRLANWRGAEAGNDVGGWRDGRREESGRRMRMDDLTVSINHQDMSELNFAFLPPRSNQWRNQRTHPNRRAHRDYAEVRHHAVEGHCNHSRPSLFGNDYRSGPERADCCNHCTPHNQIDYEYGHRRMDAAPPHRHHSTNQGFNPRSQYEYCDNFREMPNRRQNGPRRFNNGHQNGHRHIGMRSSGRIQKPRMPFIDRCHAH